MSTEKLNINEYFYKNLCYFKVIRKICKAITIVHSHGFSFSGELTLNDIVKRVLKEKFSSVIYKTNFVHFQKNTYDIVIIMQNGVKYEKINDKMDVFSFGMIVKKILQKKCIFEKQYY